MPLLEKRHLAFFFYLVVIAALVFSPFLLSVGMISLAVLSLIRFEIGPGRFWVDLDRAAIRRMGSLPRSIFTSSPSEEGSQRPAYAAITLYFFIVLLSFWQTEDLSYWLARLRIKVPFLVLPFVFLGLPKMEERQFHHLLYFFLLLLLLSAFGVLANYVVNYEEIQQALKVGHPMPTPRNHIRYSRLLAFGILCGGYLYTRGYVWRFSRERYLLIFATAFLFFFIHLLSVRSGIAVLYFALFVLLVRYIIVSRRILLGALLLVGLVVLPLLAYQYIPSYRAKISYMRWGLLKFQEGEGAPYSDAGRIVSLQLGWELAKEHPLFGVGAGNLLRETEAAFEASYPEFKEPLVPHNQFLFVLAGTGLFGLLLFLLAFLFPFFHQKNYRHTLFLGFYAIVFSAFMLEHVIENAMGVGFVLFFLLLFLRHGLGNGRV